MNWVHWGILMFYLFSQTMMEFLLLVYLFFTILRLTSTYNSNNFQDLQNHCKCHKRPTGPPSVFYRQASDQPIPVPVPVPSSGFPYMPYIQGLPPDIARSIANGAFTQEMPNSGSIPILPMKLPIIVLPFYAHGFNPYRNTLQLSAKLPKPTHKKQLHQYLIKRDDLSSETGNVDNASNSCNGRCKKTQGKKNKEYWI